MVRKNELTSTLDKFIGQKLYDLRKERKMTRTELGAALKISYQQILKYESGINRISASRLFLIAQIFKQKIDFFYDGFQEYLVKHTNYKLSKSEKVLLCA